MSLALHDARERGATTTSLQATKMGYPLYARLGYRDLGALQMWERRKGGRPVVPRRCSARMTNTSANTAGSSTIIA